LPEAFRFSGLVTQLRVADSKTGYALYSNQPQNACMLRSVSDPRDLQI